MLVLGRKIGERIKIGKDIYITVIEIKYPWSQVKLGIDAPDDVVVDREEIAIKRDKEGKKCLLSDNMK